jgi:hypothetical protein
MKSFIHGQIFLFVMYHILLFSSFPLCNNLFLQNTFYAKVDQKIESCSARLFGKIILHLSELSVGCYLDHEDEDSIFLQCVGVH